MSESISRKEFVVGVAALGAVASLLPGCSAGSKGASGETLPKGVYEAETLGAMGNLKVRVTFKNDSISDVAISSSETEIGQAAIPTLQKAIVAANGPEVDAVAGATLTTNAIREAVANCIAQSKGTAEKQGHDDLVSPVPTLKPPAKWDYEADVACIGSSGAGLIIGARMAAAGKKVIIVEKENDVGGGGRIATCLMVFGGTPGIYAADPNVGAFGTPYHDIDVVDYFSNRSNWTADRRLLMNMAICAREVQQFWIDNKANLLTPHMGGWWIYWNNATSVEHPSLSGESSNRHMLDLVRGVAEKNGAQILFQTTGKQLVMDNGKCVGFSAVDSTGKTIYVKGKDAVVLSADGMQRNHGLLKKYGGLAAAAQSARAKGTGLPFRMGLGAGADVAGIGSWGSNEGDPVLYRGEERSQSYMPSNTAFGDYFCAVIRMPFLRVDKNCDRVSVITDAALTKSLKTTYDPRTTSHAMAAEEMALGGSYTILDGAWKTKVEAFGDPTLSYAIQPSMDPWANPVEWRGILEDPDASLAENLKKGIVKKGNTIEELAKELGLDPTKLTATVKAWNDNVAKGIDDPIYGYVPSQNRPIDTPPYYGCYLTPAMYGSYMGLKVTPKNQVVDTKGEVIPNLYASFMTAGGLAGTYTPGMSCMGDQVCSQYYSGWNITKALLGEEYVEI